MATDTPLPELTAFRAAELLRRGEISSVELTEAVLQRIHALEPKLHAYLCVTADEALSAARAADALLRRGDASSRIARRTGIMRDDASDVTLPLQGVPMTIKDVISTQGVTTTAGSRILEGFVPVYDATVVEKLKAAGAHLIGKTNPDEFAMGSSTETSGYGVTRNPWDLERVPGGSSGGSAAAMSADEGIFALGTDTGGSVRQPASFTNTVGLRPSYGRVSRWGVIAFASSLDQVGPMTKDVRDAAFILNLIAGHDSRDSTTVNLPVPNFLDALQDDSLRGVRVGVPREYFVQGLARAVETTVRTAIAHLESLGAEIREVSLPHTEYALPTYYILAPAEASANLARYDSVKYSLRADVPGDVWDVMRATRGRGFGSEVKRRIMLGTYALSAGYYDAYYLKAQKVRTLIKRDFDEAFDQVDVLVSAASPSPPFRIGEKLDDPIQMYLADVFTLAQPLAGIPAISIPAGMSAGLPVGMQIMARAFEEEKILRVAYAYEQTTDWHKQKPKNLIDG
ncbi:MAG TPA: Asp-tRNA(Asn)/Glu-tRNA(Gln) amidotransferase subunit GatA [Anaerolineae bacterium]|nr:Asp-tRNA(Asn)/Glu-tRNA(Gln) amidotransferase subunit GatA [Anaerolineae bacterium]